MLRIYDQTTQEVYHDGHLHLDKVSVGLNANRTLVVQSSAPVTLTSSSDAVQFAKLTGDALNLSRTTTINQLHQYNPVHLNLFSEESHETGFIIHASNTDGDQITFTVNVNFEENDDRLVTLLNNNGVRINDTWYKAIKSSDLSKVDCIVLNRKRREFLLDLITLTGCISGYNNLFAALDFFEWSDILSIKEYWKQGSFDKYRLTETGNKVINQDLLIDGFIKTNWLGMYFDLNVPDDNFDRDGFPNYIPVDIAIEDIWTKLYYLKQILQETFLPTNVKIIDIIGQHTSFAGQQINTWTNHLVVTDVNPNPHVEFDTMALNSSSKDAIILTDNYCFRKLPVFVDDDGLIQLNPSAPSASPTENIFKINKSREELKTYVPEDLELLTQFYRGDFAQVQIDIKATDEELARVYQYQFGLQIYDTAAGKFNMTYLSDKMGYDQLLADAKLGIRSAGRYRFVVAIHNGYGGADIISDTLEFTVSIESLDIQLYAISDKLDNALKYDIGFNTTIPTTSLELVVPDAFDTSFDIADRSTARPGRYYKNKMTERQLTTMINQYNMMQGDELKFARAIDYSTYHEVLLFGFHGNTTTLNMRLYERHPYTTVSMPTANDFQRSQMVSRLNEISFRDTDWKNPFNRYTYQLTEYSIDGTMTNTRPVIMAFAKKADQFFNRILHDLPTLPLASAKLRMLAIHRGMFRVDKIWNASVIPSVLRVVVGRDQHILENVVITTPADLVQQLKTIPALSVLPTPNGKVIVSAAGQHIYIEHPAIGKYYDVARNTGYDNLKKAKIGQDFQVTVPVFATPENRVNVSDYLWQITNRYTGELVHTENNEVMAWLPFETGIFDIKLTMQDALTGNSIISSFKRGGIRVSGTPFQERDGDETFYNVTKSDTFYSMMCGGVQPKAMIYTVEAKKYSSTISQEDADSKALEEIKENGQNWANEFGICGLQVGG